MLDKLVVSKDSTKENKRVGNFLITSFLAMVSVLTVGLIYSLFTYNLAMGNENLSISTLVAPVLETEIKPETPKEEVKTNKNKPENNPTIITRKTNTQRTDESPVKAPDKISVKPSNVLARPKGAFKIGKIDSKKSMPTAGVINRGSSDTGTPIGSVAINKKSVNTKPVIDKPKIEKPPALEKETKKIKKKPVTVSKGVINGKASKLVQPVYSQAAKTMNVRGKVTVQVLIDENGNVISAKAIKGHPLLKQSAVRAARASKFTPTYLSNQKVKVSGMIIYNFIK